MGLFTPLRFDGLAGLDIGVARVIEAVHEAAKLGAEEGAKLLVVAWQNNVNDILIHGYAIGNYHDSIQAADPQIVGEYDVEVEVFSDAEAHGDDYPFFLEYGTSRIPGGYPTMTPAFESTKDTVTEKCAETQRAALETWFP